MLNLWVGLMKESKETISEWMCLPETSILLKIIYEMLVSFLLFWLAGCLILDSECYRIYVVECIRL